MSFSAAMFPARAVESNRFSSMLVTVVDATSHAPLAFATVGLHGAVERRGITDAAGVVRFSALPPGSYALTFWARRHLPLTIRVVAVSANAERKLRVALHLLSPSLQQPVRATRLATITRARSDVRGVVPQAQSDTVTESSYSTRISDSVLTSLGMLPGVVLQSTGGDIGASVGGRSTGQTQTSIDGVPVIGSAQSLGLFSSGIFSRASADVGNSSLSFTTPDPTLDWLTRLTKVEGDHGASRTTFGESGTAGRLGVSLTYSNVGSVSALNGMRYVDASGIDYVHDGISTGDAFAAKLRYPTSRFNSLSFAYDALDTSAPDLCDVFTAQVPCGSGPRDRDIESIGIARISDSWSSPIIDGMASFSSQSNASYHDGSGIFESGVATPMSSLDRSLSDAIEFAGTIHIGPRYGVTVNWRSTATRSESQFAGGVGGGAPPYQYPSSHLSSFALNAPIVQSRRFTANIGVTSNAQLGSATSGLKFNVTYRPTNKDAIALRYQGGAASRPTGYADAVSQPNLLTFDCANHTAIGRGPSSLASATQTSLVGATWTRSGTKITSQIAVTHAIDRNGLVEAIVAAPELEPGLFGPTYASGLTAAGESACGAGSGYTLDDALFSVAEIAPRVIYDSAQMAIQMRIGSDIYTGLSAGVLSARAFGTDSPIFSPRSTVIQGRQLPGRPYATATWSLGYGSGHGLLVLLDANYTSKNNPRALPAYATFDASISEPTQHGTLSVALLNMANAHPGPFATSTDSIPLPMLDGSYRPPGQPLPPRTFEVQYRVNVGKSPESLEAMLASGTGRLLDYDSRVVRDPYGIDRQSQLCGPELVPESKALIAAIASYVGSIQAATVSGELPATFADGAFQGVRLIYRRNGSGFVVMLARMPAISRGTIRTFQRDVLSCGTVRTGTLAQARLAGLYVPSFQERTTQDIFYGFSPKLGFYILPQLIDEPVIRYLPLPHQPPIDPFAIGTGPGCTDEIRPAAAAFLDALKKFATAYYTTRTAEPETSLDITAHSDTGVGGWLEVKDDGGYLDPLLPCLVVHTGNADDFERAGVPIQPPGSIDYAPALGLYIFR